MHHGRLLIMTTKTGWFPEDDLCQNDGDVLCTMIAVRWSHVRRQMPCNRVVIIAQRRRRGRSRVDRCVCRLMSAVSYKRTRKGSASLPRS